MRLINLSYDIILVGGYAVILHGHPRTTEDMDIWVEKSLTQHNKRFSETLRLVQKLSF